MPHVSLPLRDMGHCAGCYSNPLPCRRAPNPSASPSTPAAPSPTASGSTAAASACSKSSPRPPIPRKPSSKPSAKSTARRRTHPPPRHHRRHQHAAPAQRRAHRARHHAGFEDAIEIGRQARPKLYDFFFDRIEPLVPKDLRFGINERTASDGEILTSPTPEELQALADQIARSEPQSIAISLLFSFANPKNEQAVAEALERLGVPLSISHQILPEFREYERTSTVVINAYLQPVMQRYLENLGRVRATGTSLAKPGRRALRKTALQRCARATWKSGPSEPRKALRNAGFSPVSRPASSSCNPAAASPRSPPPPANPCAPCSPGPPEA